MMPEKVLVFKQIILFREIKFGGEIEGPFSEDFWAR